MTVADLIVEHLSTKNVNDIVVNHDSHIASCVIIATGVSTRQNKFVAQEIAQKLKSTRGGSVTIEGLQMGSWVLLTCGDVVLHMFIDEARKHYNIDELYNSRAQ